MFLRFFSLLPQALLPWPQASVLFTGLFLISHGFDLYDLIRYGSRFFWGARQGFNQSQFISLNLLNVSSTSQSRHIFSVFWCHSFPKFRCRNVCQSFCRTSSVGLHFQGWRHRFSQSLALGFILNQLPVWTFKYSIDIKHAITYFWLSSWVLLDHLALLSFRPKRPHSSIVFRPSVV